MSAAKHTPGPWRAHLHKTAKQSRWQVMQDKSGQPGFGEYKIADGVTFEEDARLMAEAPNLAFQLLAAANYIDALGGDSRRYRAAIAKATGSN